MASLSDSTLQYGWRRRFNPARAVRVSSFASLRVLAMLRAPLENVRQNVRQRCRRTASDTQGQELQKCRSIEAFSKTRTYGLGRALVSFKAKTSRNSSFTRKHPPLPMFAAGASAVSWNRLSN